MNFDIFSAEKHYEEILGWWKARGWPKVELYLLSNFGLVVHDEKGTNLCAGWLYLTPSAFYIVDWFVSNPHAPLRLRTQGLEYLIERLVAEAEGFGKYVAFTSVKSRGLIRLLKRQGFKVGDEGMTNLTRVSKGVSKP